MLNSLNFSERFSLSGNHSNINTSARSFHKLLGYDNHFILFCAALQFCEGLSETNLNEFGVSV